MVRIVSRIAAFCDPVFYLLLSDLRLLDLGRLSAPEGLTGRYGPPAASTLMLGRVEEEHFSAPFVLYCALLYKSILNSR